MYNNEGLLTIYIIVYKNYSRDEIEGYVRYLIKRIEAITYLGNIVLNPKAKLHF